MNVSRLPMAFPVMVVLLLLPMVAAPAGAGAGLPGFVPNHGQWDGQVLFRTCAGGAVIWFTPGSAVYEFVRPAVGPSCPDRLPPGRQEPPRDLEALVIRSVLVGAGDDASCVGREALPHSVSYLLGSSEEEWVTGVLCYGRMLVRDVYPGIDVEYATSAGGLKYSFVVHPGADLSLIATRWDGVTCVEESPCGGLRIGTVWGEVFEGSPEAWQEIAGVRVPVECRYDVQPDGTIRYEAGETDPAADLVIDPLVSLSYSTYLGGSGIESSTSLAVDAGGSAYVTGYTLSTDFPTQVPYQGSFAGGTFDAFVTKLTTSGSTLSYSTYLGGSGDDIPYGIAVDASGCAYITGYTTSSNFPTLAPFQAAPGGGTNDAFLTKLAASGSALSYSTYLGGNGHDDAYAVTVDASGAAYMAGRTISTDFPTQNPFQGSFGGGNQDAYAVKFSPSGTTLSYGTYLGGSILDEAYGIAVDASGCAYVTGYTTSSNFPTQNPFQAGRAGEADVFVVKFTAGGGSLVYGTYLGGSFYDYGTAIAVDAWGRAVITGGTESADFPTQNPYQGSVNDIDAIVARFSASGSELSYSTFYGGTGFDYAQGIAVDAEGCAYITGYTNCSDFPLVNAYQGSYGGGYYDSFAVKLFASGSQPVYSTYLGGNGSDVGYGIRVDGSGRACVSGNTASTNFPTLTPFQASLSGTVDAFVTRFTTAGTGIGEGTVPAPPSSLCTSVSPSPCSGVVQVTVDAASTGPVAITVFGLDGRVAARLGIGAWAPGPHSTSWDTSGMPSGIYMVHAEDDSGSEAGCRLVVIR